MKFIAIHRLSYLARAGLGMVLVVVAMMTLAVVVEARETYADFATRILVERPAGVEIRPDLESAILLASNSYRATKSYPRLKATNKILLQAARAHAMDLLTSGTMGHRSSTGYEFESRIRAFHKGQMIFAPMAENAARLRNSKLADAEIAQALVQQWIKSAGHRKNLINRSYVEVAVGVVKRGDDVYAVQIFSGPEVKSNILGSTAN